ncbi:glycoside hydrolase family 16 protein [Nitratireductor sp. GISD-1A_MAKvit]|uniref:glycoside hydrolase family 16 protein n=1 Tax=Nitratireductor sp. GISD-1A_MAKvit TaxID=3234198 RepID=UPI003465D6F9
MSFATGKPPHLSRRRALVGGAAVLAMSLVTAFVPGSSLAGDQLPTQSDMLNVETMEISFNEDFATLDVSAWGPGTRWIAHTPWAGDFGGARFANPDERSPFRIVDGKLHIEAKRDPEGDWQSGLLASVDADGNGFSQQYGYFEMRARLPEGPGVWPAFWLIGRDRSKATAEIDVIEFYGDKPEGYSSVVHVWHRDGRHYSRFHRNAVFVEARPGAFHTYGVKVDPGWIRFYFNREFVWKTETQPEHRQPLYILLNLALVDGPTKDDTPDPSHMIVDYVRAYRLDRDL